MSKTETPRTDIEPPPYAGFDSCVPRDFARTLERELSASQAEVERLRKRIAQIEEGIDALLALDNPAEPGAKVSESNTLK